LWRCSLRASRFIQCRNTLSPLGGRDAGSFLSDQLLQFPVQH
jgi:hypothetical protein